MRVMLFVLCAVAFGSGLLLLGGQRSEIRVIEAGFAFLIGSVFLAGGCVCETIASSAQHLEDIWMNGSRRGNAAGARPAPAANEHTSPVEEHDDVDFIITGVDAETHRMRKIGVHAESAQDAVAKAKAAGITPTNVTKRGG
jgi:hypothetical protein